MIWVFMIGLLIGTIVLCNKTQSKKGAGKKKQLDRVLQESVDSVRSISPTNVGAKTPKKENDREKLALPAAEERIDIPITILPNLYSFELRCVSIKHHISYMDGKERLNYITLKGEFWYKLNGQRKGKRQIIVTSYDEHDEVIEIYGENKTYRFTEAGCEVLDVCFNDCRNKMPCRISILVREILDDRTP